MVSITKMGEEVGYHLPPLPSLPGGEEEVINHILTSWWWEDVVVRLWEEGEIVVGCGGRVNIPSLTRYVLIDMWDEDDDFPSHHLTWDGRDEVMGYVCEVVGDIANLIISSHPTSLTTIESIERMMRDVFPSLPGGGEEVVR